jgi:hypothetical protein
LVRERSCVQSTPAAPPVSLKSLGLCTTRLSCVVLHHAERCSNMRAKWHVFDTRCSGDVSPTLLRPILIGQLAAYPTKTKRPVVLVGHGPASQSVASVNPWVSGTEDTQSRDGETLCPDTVVGSRCARSLSHFDREVAWGAPDHRDVGVPVASLQKSARSA